MEGGVKKWVAEMPDHILGDQFPQAPPIFVKDDLVDNFFKQRALRETEIQAAVETMVEVPEDRERILNTYFKQTFSECNPYFGKPCTYLKLCHGHVQEPLKEGWSYREPHHAKELEQWAEKV
jgi:hypothetical protein